eukprot:scaffold14153_cov61-Phaeocystis_antarctica.AAC.2
MAWTARMARAPQTETASTPIGTAAVSTVSAVPAPAAESAIPAETAISAGTATGAARESLPAGEASLSSCVRSITLERSRLLRCCSAGGSSGKAWLGLGVGQGLGLGRGRGRNSRDPAML